MCSVPTALGGSDWAQSFKGTKAGTSPCPLLEISSQPPKLGLMRPQAEVGFRSLMLVDGFRCHMGERGLESEALRRRGHTSILGFSTVKPGSAFHGGKMT